MLPLSLLNVATGSPLLVELKGGDTYNGRLVSCDSWMNMNLREVICTSKDGDRFWKLPSCYIRGSAIKYLRLPPDLLDKAKAEGADDDERRSAGRGGGRGGYQAGGRGGRGGPARTGGRGRGRDTGRGRTAGRGPARGNGGTSSAGGGGGRGGGRHGRGRGREGESNS